MRDTSVNAGVFSQGQNVQAIDELGRWEPATVVEVIAVDKWKVHFKGWSRTFDRIVDSEAIRLPIDLFNHDGDLPQRRPKRNRDKTSCQTLRNISSGDTVNVGGKMLKVAVIDRFKKKITLEDGQTVDAMQVGSKDTNTANTSSTQLKRRKKTNCTSGQRAETKGNSKLCPRSEEQEKLQSVEGDIERGANTAELTTIDWFDTLNEHGVHIKCGSVYQIDTLQWDVAVIKLNSKEEEPVEAVAVTADGTIDMDIKISVPVTKLTDNCDRSLCSTAKRQLSHIASNSHINMLKALSNSPFCERMKYRKCQLGHILRKEARSALQSRSRRKRFCLGPASPEDLEILRLSYTQRKKTYSYNAENLSDIDSLCGREWDLLVKGLQVRFITQLSVCLNKDFLIYCTMVTAVATVTVTGQQYRKSLKHHLQNVPTAQEDATSDDGSDVDEMPALPQDVPQ